MNESIIEVKDKEKTAKLIGKAEVDNADELCQTCQHRLNKHYMAGLTLVCIVKNCPHVLKCDLAQVKFNQSYKNVIHSIVNEFMPYDQRFKIKR